MQLHYRSPFLTAVSFGDRPEKCPFVFGSLRNGRSRFDRRFIKKVFPINRGNYDHIPLMNAHCSAVWRGTPLLDAAVSLYFNDRFPFAWKTVDSKGKEFTVLGGNPCFDIRH
ncbi:hypothetical protein CDAR_474461 [Caerostris darwini]|uniref:Uncharacterized protein n=1 Tax=Caerostris darwini TaxID=1538125 RepID=A0AAV4M591_9ARAC|nr:hypothetical protein CDAR_474461 [Caerostris darwini]